MSVFSGCKSQFFIITQSWMCVLLLYYCFVMQNHQIRFYWTSFNVMTSSCNIDYVVEIRIYFRDAKYNFSQNSIMGISIFKAEARLLVVKTNDGVASEKGNTKIKLEEHFHEYTGIPRKAVDKYVKLWSFWCKVWRPTTKQQENPS